MSKLRQSLDNLFEEFMPPFRLDEDNENHLVVKDCCGEVVLSSHIHPDQATFMEYNKRMHLRQRLIARVLLNLANEI